MSKKEARRPEPSCFFGGAFSTALEHENLIQPGESQRTAPR